MGLMRKAAAVLAAVGVGITALPAAAAPQCKAKCNNVYQQCLTGKPQEACLKTWSQCKRTCMGVAPASSTKPVKAPVTTTTPRR